MKMRHEWQLGILKGEGTAYFIGRVVRVRRRGRGNEQSEESNLFVMGDGRTAVFCEQLIRVSEKFDSE